MVMTLLVSYKSAHQLTNRGLKLWQYMQWSQGSSVGITTGYGLGSWDSGIRFPFGAGNFSLFHSVQTSSGAHPASYPMDTGGSFTEGKVAKASS
jgi:hypothetical protein